MLRLLLAALAFAALTMNSGPASAVPPNVVGASDDVAMTWTANSSAEMTTADGEVQEVTATAPNVGVAVHEEATKQVNRTTEAESAAAMRATTAGTVNTEDVAVIRVGTEVTAFVIAHDNNDGSLPDGGAIDEPAKPTAPYIMHNGSTDGNANAIDSPTSSSCKPSCACCAHGSPVEAGLGPNLTN